MTNGIIPGRVQNASINANDDNKSVSDLTNKGSHCGRIVELDKTSKKAGSFLASTWKTFVRQVRRIRDFCILRRPAMPSPSTRQAEAKLMLAEDELVVTYIDAHLKIMKDVATQVLAPPFVRKHSYVDASGLPVRGMHRWRKNQQILSSGKSVLNSEILPLMLSSGETKLNNAIQDADSPFHQHFISLCEELRANHPDMPVLTILSEANRQSFDDLKATLASDHPAELLSAAVDQIDAETRKLIEDSIYLPKLELEKAYAQTWNVQSSATEPALNQAIETQLPWFETTLKGTELDLFKTFRKAAVELLLEFFPDVEIPEIKKTIVANFKKDFDALYQRLRLVRNSQPGGEIPPVSHDLYKSLASTTIDPGPYLNTKEYGKYLIDLICRFEMNKPARENRLEGRTAILMPVMRSRPPSINSNAYLTKMPDQANL
ncbi:MAG TPA: hypothetical protein VGM52_01595 [Herbaspirillum sp.]